MNDDRRGNPAAKQGVRGLSIIRRPTFIAISFAMLACATHAQAIHNEFALDDVPIVRDNPAAHSVSRAIDAWLDPYWPASAGSSAGQYRPFTILTFAAEWSVTDGAVGWLHASNILLHGLVTALVVFVLCVWLSAPGLWVAGVLFAVHPVHVEAVAGLVGRAELLVAAVLLGAVLAGRRYRAATRAVPRYVWSAVVVVLVVIGLFSKEHAVIAVALLALDHALTDRAPLRRTAGLYVAVCFVTLAWLHLFQGVAGQYVEGSRAAVFRGLSHGQRVATMLPAQLDVVRLLAWPFDLAADYNPQMIVQRFALDWSGILGGLVATATIGLGLAATRRAPAVAFGILAGIMAYAPTSNLLFASGVALAERNLYLSVLAPAAALGWIASTAHWNIRRWVLTGVALMAVAFAGRSAERLEAWHDSLSIIADDLVNHPENYRTRLRLSSYLMANGDQAGALAEEMVAVSLFPRDPFIAPRSVPRSLMLGLDERALAEAHSAYDQLPDHPVLAELLVDAYLANEAIDSALAVARNAIVRAPRSDIPIRAYGRVLTSLDAPQWKDALNEVRLHYVYSRFGVATSALHRVVESAERSARIEPADCWDIESASRLSAALAPRLVGRFEAMRPSGCLNPSSSVSRRPMTQSTDGLLNL